MWIKYSEKYRHEEDFIVKYKFYKYEEGGRKEIFQGYRCDFAYSGDDIHKDGIYAIHPEFLDDEGNVILDENRYIDIIGTAKMWIVFYEMRENVHKNRIKVGTKGYFMEGSKRVGEIEVIKVTGLEDNIKYYKSKI